jgi:RNA polymerase sigma factor (sigma-70 family)
MEAFSIYLRDVGKHKQLSFDEECALALRAQSGDISARKELAARNVSLVISTAKVYARMAPIADLVGEGNIGLMQAIDKFDVGKGFRFATYARWWIRAAMTAYLDRSTSVVRRGELADYSLDAPLNQSTPEATDADPMLDDLVDSKPLSLEALESLEQRRDVSAALGRVKARLGALGWDVLHARIMSDEPLTLRELGERWKLSREGVRLAEKRVRELLERYLHELAPGAECEA